MFLPLYSMLSMHNIFLHMHLPSLIIYLLYFASWINDYNCFFLIFIGKDLSSIGWASLRWNIFCLASGILLQSFLSIFEGLFSYSNHNLILLCVSLLLFWMCSSFCYLHLVLFVIREEFVISKESFFIPIHSLSLRSSLWNSRQASRWHHMQSPL